MKRSIGTITDLINIKDLIIMRICFILHAAFETPGVIETWAQEKGYTLSTIHAYKGDKLPHSDEFDFLILMGGPQSAREYDCYDYLIQEVELLKEALALDKKILGICLGAQLIGEALGAPTEKSPYKEVGSYPIYFGGDALEDSFFEHFGQEQQVMHWHGDMPGLSYNTLLAAYSEGCPHQAVRYQKGVYGLQFHAELTKVDVERMILACPQDLAKGPYIQTAEHMLSSDFEAMNQCLLKALDAWVKIDMTLEDELSLERKAA
jgi:GMP synthase (glutamine-hydrolysing)